MTQFSHKNVIHMGYFELDTITSTFPNLSKERVKHIEKLVEHTKRPRMAGYVGAELEDLDNLPETVRKARLDQGKGALGEELALLLLENREGLKIIQQLSIGVDSYDSRELRSNNREVVSEQSDERSYAKERWLQKNLEASLFALLVSPDKVTWSFDYLDEDDQCDHLDNLDKFKHIWYHGNYRFESKEPIVIEEYVESRFQRPITIIPQTKNLKIISALSGISTEELQYHYTYRTAEVQFWIEKVSHFQFHRRLSFLTPEQRIQYNTMFDDLRDRYWIEYYCTIIQDEHLSRELKRRRVSRSIFKFDLCLVVKRKLGKQSIMSVEVKSSSITCKDHGNRGPVSLSSNQRSMMMEIIQSDLMSENLVHLRVIKLNFCECGLVFYYLIEPQLIIKT